MVKKSFRKINYFNAQSSQRGSAAARALNPLWRSCYGDRVARRKTVTETTEIERLHG